MAHCLQGLADRGQVVGLVPLREQLQVGDQLFARALRERERHFAESAFERGARRHAVFLCPVSCEVRFVARFRCTSRSEMAAGVTPEMRAAWPIVSGRWRASFWRTSFDKPRTAS